MSSGDPFEMEHDWEKETEEIDAQFFFQEMETELKKYLLEQQVEVDSTVGTFELIDNLTNRLQEDFDEIIGDYVEKKLY